MKCKPINIIWIERGILYTIIYYIIKNYDKIKNKIIIIDNKIYRKILKKLFNNLIFKKYNENKESSNNFYFNVRKINKQQDIIIDYLKNYEYINANKINLVPWYDMNDVLIVYEYDKKYIKNVDEYNKFIKMFSECKRSNYNNMIWDVYMELKILKLYSDFNKEINIVYVLNYINKYFKNNYINTSIKQNNSDNQNTYYIPVPILNNTGTNDKLLDTLTQHLDLTNKVIQKMVK
jgi:hypothetical protein